MDRIIDLLRSKNKYFICIDFDHTIVDIHTYGRWQKSADELESHIRPFFKGFIPLLISSGLHVAVVTFSSQVPIISQLLKRAFPAFADEIIIRGTDNSWEYVGNGQKEGHFSLFCFIRISKCLFLQASRNIARPLLLN
jgi:hypothetical protein